MEENTKEQQPVETKPGAKSKFDPKLIAGLVLIIVAVIGAFFLFRGQGQAPSPVQTTQTQKVPATPGSDVEGMVVSEEGGAKETVREIVVEGDEFSFSPASISVKAGENIKLTFNNAGSTPHNLKVEGLGIGTSTIGGGESETIEFTAEEDGTYATFCSVGNHRALGMEGTLVIE